MYCDCFLILGTSVINAGSGKFPANQMPLLLCGGQVVLETASGRLTQMILSTHEVSGSNIHDIHKANLEQALNKQLKLHRLVTECMPTVSVCKSDWYCCDAWKVFSGKGEKNSYAILCFSEYYNAGVYKIRLEQFMHELVFS